MLVFGHTSASLDIVLSVNELSRLMRLFFPEKLSLREKLSDLGSCKKLFSSVPSSA